MAEIIASNIEIDEDDEVYYLCEDELITDTNAYAPRQYKNKESDFTILYEDGSVAYAKWVK